LRSESEATGGPLAETTRLRVTGIGCAACINKIETTLLRLDGVDEAAVSLTTGLAMVRHDASRVSVGDLRRAVESLGYGAQVERIASRDLDRGAVGAPACCPVEGQGRRAAEGAGASGGAAEAAALEEVRRLRLTFLGSLLFTALVLLGGMGGRLPFVPSFLSRPVTQLVLATPVQFVAGWRFYRGAWAALRQGAADMNVLIATGTSAAYGLSLAMTLFPAFFAARGIAPVVYFDSAAMIVTLVLFGRLLESLARRRASGAIRKLLRLRPATARVLRDGSEREVPVEEVRVGETIIVRPGERVPLDGEVVAGESTLDESALTGESLPVDRGPGDRVLGAGINLTGAFRLRVTHAVEDTVLAQVINLVEEAQMRKAPVQRLVDRVAAYFVPVVIGVAALSFGVWLAVGPQPALIYATVAAVSVLVIACPCSLGLATPAAITVGTGRGAELGVLIRGGDVLEGARRLTTILFDKTGTLTEGRPRVTELRPAAGVTEEDLLRAAAAVEGPSEHPLARAIVEEAGRRGVEPPEVAGFEALPGRGVVADLKDERLRAGSVAYLEGTGVDTSPLAAAVDELSRAGRTTILVARGTRLLGLAALADTLKPGAAEAVRELRRRGLAVAMITGDDERTARRVAAEAGIAPVLARVLPGDKAGEVRRLQEEGETVAMVGDGINDAPALAQADVGIAVGTGTDIAVEASDITLVTGDPRGVVRAIELSRRTVRIIRQNLFWAFFYNTVGIPVAAGVLYPAFGLLLSPAWAAAAMSLSSVSVVTNALRLRGFR